MVKAPHSLMHPLPFHPYRRPHLSSSGQANEEAAIDISLARAPSQSPARTRIRRRPRKAVLSSESDVDEEHAGISTSSQLDMGLPAFVERQSPPLRSLPLMSQLDETEQRSLAGREGESAQAEPVSATG